MACRPQTGSELVGVSLLSDGSGEPVANLGVVVIPAESNARLTLAKLRQLLRDQIPPCPPSFRFLLRGRWPISTTQESSLTLKNVTAEDGSISIQRVHSKPKVGIKARSGMGLGFIFSELSLTLADLRTLIQREVPFFSGVQDSYHFLDANGWPVMRQLERYVQVSEVLASSCVLVGMELPPQAHEASDETDGNWMRHLSFSSSKDMDRQISLHTTPPQSSPAAQAAIAAADTSPDKRRKQLLISYVRAEAADYALHLKMKLAELGFSVYLDVHEISVGVDWQDSLNFAVSNCEVFIPLVTPRYGETLWTNREVKLADVLGKYILPVNFLPEWPPRCLAIQFATTQFVVCSPSFTPAMSNVNADCKDGSRKMASWDLEDITTAAGEICKKLRRLSKTEHAVTSAPSLTRMRTLRKTFVGKLPAMSKMTSASEADIPPSKIQLVVICLHPEQQAFGQEVKQWLEGRCAESYSVWLSCETELPSGMSDTQSVPSSPNVKEEDDGGQNSSESGGTEGQNARFQNVSDKAAVVLVILSKEFTESQTCKQQMFYCEQRKPIVPIHLYEFSMPGWLNMLLRTSCAEGVSQHNYRQNLMARLDRILHSAAPENQGHSQNEAMVSHAVDQIKKTVSTDCCIYIAGSTTFRNEKSINICKSIGVHLARLEAVSIATGGFFGIGETVSRAFYEESQRLERKGEVWHILPDRDVKDFRKRASQNPDGTFAVATFGKTLFFGDSVRQRESIVGRCFEICILVEGGPGAAHEAEEFVWNDRLVIPLGCTGGAAGGKFSLPEKMFEKPRGVTDEDWQSLRSTDLSADEIGKCVAQIVMGILQHLSVTRRRSPTCSSTPASVRDDGDSDTTPPLASSFARKVSPQVVGQNRSSLSNRETVILG